MRKDTRLSPLYCTGSAESWAGPGNEANQVLQVTCAASDLYDKIIITIVPSYILETYHSFVAIANVTHAAHL